MKLRITHILAAAATVFAVQAAVAGSIVASKHDFTAAGTQGGTAWSGGQICLPCHAPHNNLNAAGTLLWNHASTTSTFTLYSSPTMDSPTAQPGGTSKLCLSCHDGTVALDSFGGATGTTLLTGAAKLGIDLSNDHPISMAYNPTVDPALKATTTSTTIGSGASTKTGPISSLLLYAGNVECSSCHDVHNTYTAGTTGLLKISNAASALCLTCHIK